MTSLVAKVIAAVCCCAVHRRGKSCDRTSQKCRSHNPFTQCNNVDVIIHQSVVKSHVDDLTTVVEKASPDSGLVTAGGSRRLWRRLEFWRPGHGAAGPACPTSKGQDLTITGPELTSLPAIADLRHVGDVNSSHEDVTSSAGDDIRIEDWSAFSDGGQPTSITESMLKRSASTLSRQQHQELRGSDIILLPSRNVERASERAVERAATLVHDSLYACGQLVPWRHHSDNKSSNDVTGYHMLPTSNDFRLQERRLVDENLSSATDPEMSESTGTDYEDLNAVVRSTAVLKSYRRALPPKSRARTSWSLRRPLQENGPMLHEPTNETEAQRQRNDAVNSSNPNSRRPRRSDLPASAAPADVATSRFSNGTSADAVPRRSHGTWAHGATTAAGQCCRSDSVATGRSRAPPSAINRPCRSPAHCVVTRRPNDVISVVATSRMELSNSTAVVKSPGDVIIGVRFGLTNSNIGDNRLHMEHDVMHDVTSQLQQGHINTVEMPALVCQKLEKPVPAKIQQPCPERGVCSGIKKRLTSLEACRSAHVVPRADQHQQHQQQQHDNTVDHPSTIALKSMTSTLSKRSSYRLTRIAADKLLMQQHQLSDAKMTKWRYFEGVRQEEYREMSVDGELDAQNQQQQQQQLGTEEILSSTGKTSDEVSLSSSSVAELIARLNGRAMPTSGTVSPSGGGSISKTSTAVAASRSEICIAKGSVSCNNNNNNKNKNDGNTAKPHVIGPSRSRDSVGSQSKTSISSFKDRALAVERNATKELITKGNIIRFSIEHEPTMV